MTQEACVAESIGTKVIAAARELFEDYGIFDDFNTLHHTPDGVRFGTENHIYWTPTRGFAPDRTHCTREFLDRWDGDI